MLFTDFSHKRYHWAKCSLLAQPCRSWSHQLTNSYGFLTSWCWFPQLGERRERDPANSRVFRPNTEDLSRLHPADQTPSKNSAFLNVAVLPRPHHLEPHSQKQSQILFSSSTSTCRHNLRQLPTTKTLYIVFSALRDQNLWSIALKKHTHEDLSIPQGFCLAADCYQWSETGRWCWCNTFTFRVLSDLFLQVGSPRLQNSNLTHLSWQLSVWVH